MTAPLPGEDPPQAPAAAVGAALAATVRLAGGHARPGQRQRLVALALAVAAHAAVLYALVQEPADPMAGGGGQQPDAISVTIVNSTVLEARDVDRLLPPAPAAAAAVESSDGAAESTPAPQRSEQHKQEQEKAQDQPVPTEAIVMVPPEAQEQERKEASATAPGGETSRGDDAASTHRNAPAAASPGAVLEYARYVSQALAQAKPKGVGTYGTVQVKLRISPDGELASVEIGKSSGNKKLDDTVLAALQQVKLRTPPSGMTADQRWYQVNYYFR
jgi:TonB family protein